MDVYDHFAIRERECRANSLVPEGSFESMCSEESGSGGRRGVFWGHLILTDDYYLDVFEFVSVDEHGVATVEKYAYYLVHSEGYEVWGLDKDPSHAPPVHGHVGPDHLRVESEEVSFTTMAERAWNTVSHEERILK